VISLLSINILLLALGETKGDRPQLKYTFKAKAFTEARAKAF